MKSELGSGMLVALYAVKPMLDEEKAKELTESLVKALNMEHADHTDVTFSYPCGGKGGVGFTLIHPITDSFIAVDTYVNLNGSYVLISSCVPFSSSKVFSALVKFGLTVQEAKAMSVSLGD